MTGNNLGQLGNADELPSPEDIAILKNAESMKAILHSTGTKEEIENLIHMQAKKLLDEGNVADAWKTLLSI